MPLPFRFVPKSRDASASAIPADRRRLEALVVDRDGTALLDCRPDVLEELLRRLSDELSVAA